MKNWITLLVLSLAYSMTLAQTNSENDITNQHKSDSDSIINTSYSIPLIPALDFISSDPTDISRPSSVRALAASLYNGIDQDGRVKQGFAIETKLSKLLGISITGDEYIKGGLPYMLYNTQLSLGSVAASGDTTDTDLGWGLRITLFDKADPMANRPYRDTIATAFLDCLPGPDNPMTEEEVNACLAQKKQAQNGKTRRENFIASNWNASWMTLAYAGGTRLKGSKLKKGTETNLGNEVWLAGGVKLDSWGQFSYMAKWSQTSRVEIDELINEFNLGAKLLIGQPQYNIFGEFSYNPLVYPGSYENNMMIDPDQVFSWTVGLEFRLTDQLWLTAGLGEEADKIIGNNGIQLISGLRTGISDHARLK